MRGERNISFVLDDKIAFDFGPHSLESLLERRIDPNKISHLLISHMHLDHFAGVPELLWYRSIYGAESALTVYGPKGIEKNVRRLLKILNTPPSWYGEQIEKKINFVEGHGADFIHVFEVNHRIPTNAYRVEYRGKVLLYSGDTSYSKNVVDGAHRADLLIHEVTYTDKEKNLANFWLHSTYSEAMEVYAESGAKHIVPVHLTRRSGAFVKRKTGKVKGLIFPSESIEL